MLPQLAKIKGVHPGTILRRELKIQTLKSSDLANSIGEHKQTISALLNKRRNINPKLSIKLSKIFNVEPDYFMLLQSSYDVKLAANLVKVRTPNLSILREALFWDTTLDKIDWSNNKRAVIKRILERGNEAEITEIISFYGKKVIENEVLAIKQSFMPAFAINVKKYNL